MAALGIPIDPFGHDIKDGRCAFRPKARVHLKRSFRVAAGSARGLLERLERVAHLDLTAVVIAAHIVSYPRDSPLSAIARS
jgi:hypothetical protein